MKRFLAALVVLALVLPTFAIAADNTRPASAHAKSVTLSGQVSSDAKSFVADDENTWTVSNPAALKGLANVHVTVKCRMEPSKRSITVLSVTEPASNGGHVSDAAFHR